MAQFLNGLRPKIVQQVELQHYVGLNDLAEKANKIERRLNRWSQLRGYSNFSPSFSCNSQPRREEKVSGSITSPKRKQDISKRDFNPTPMLSDDQNKERICDTKCFKC